MKTSNQHHPSAFNTQIRHAAECAFQRAIILGKQSKLNGQSIHWLDIELPVDFSGHPRGKCIDLIGIDESGNYVLCELKFRKQSRDNGNPTEAASQLKEYFGLIKKNYCVLSYHTENGLPIDWEKVAHGNTRLVIAANKTYWDTWAEIATNGIERYAVDIAEDTFVKQKGASEKYTPIMPEEGKTWREV